MQDKFKEMTQENIEIRDQLEKLKKQMERMRVLAAKQPQLGKARVKSQFA